MARRRTSTATATSNTDSATKLAIAAAIFAIGLGIGVMLTTLNPTPRTLDAIRLDAVAPSSDFCNNYGASAMVTTSRIYMTLNPFNVYVSQAEPTPGCVVLPNNWNLLLQKGVIEDRDIRQCKDRMNTFGFTGDLTKAPKVDCVYETRDVEKRLVAPPPTPNSNL